jgi:hypothetical protein
MLHRYYLGRESAPLSAMISNMRSIGGGLQRIEPDRQARRLSMTPPATNYSDMHDALEGVENAPQALMRLFDARGCAAVESFTMQLKPEAKRLPSSD